MRKFILLALMMITVVSVLSSNPTNALAGWKAGRIIDDSVFTNNKSMSVSAIQNFLNSKVPTCDTYGKQLSEFGGPDLNGDGKVQRWEWGKSKYNQTKFTCLKNWKSSGGTSAAQVIYNKAQAYKINPRVLIVLLQKEQSLVTDTWPLTLQYRTATGYGCPDTAPCDSQYYGLQNQLDWAAKMFRAIMNDSPTWYTPYEVGNNYIQYNPVSSCGGKTVNIENRATQALYNYTPYTPNKGALDAGWGTAPCGAYGNRNFYLYFRNWFGQPNASATYGYSVVSQELYSDSGYTTKVGDTSATVNFGTPLYAKVVIKNTGNQVWDPSLVRAGTASPRDRSSQFYDASWINSRRPDAISGSGTAQYETATLQFKLDSPASFTNSSETFGIVIEGQRWLSGSFTFDLLVQDPTATYSAATVDLKLYADPKKRFPVSPSAAETWQNHKLYVTAKIKNTGTRPFPAVTTKLATTSARDRTSDFTSSSWLGTNRVVAAREGMLYPDQTGTYNFELDTPSDITNGTYNEKFGIVIEGQRWVVDNIVDINLAVTDRPVSTINQLHTLTPGEYMVSPNDRFKLILQADGNLVLYSIQTGKALWHTRTYGKAGSELILQSDGNLVLYRTDPSRKALWHTRTYGKAGSELILQSDGNLVLYRTDPSRKALWHTRTNGAK